MPPAWTSILSCACNKQKLLVDQGSSCGPHANGTYDDKPSNITKDDLTTRLFALSSRPDLLLRVRRVSVPAPPRSIPARVHFLDERLVHGRGGKEIAGNPVNGEILLLDQNTCSMSRRHVSAAWAALYFVGDSWQCTCLDGAKDHPSSQPSSTCIGGEFEKIRVQVWNMRICALV